MIAVDRYVHDKPGRTRAGIFIAEAVLVQSAKVVAP